MFESCYHTLCCLDNVQSWIEQTCSFVFQPLLHCRKAAIIGTVFVVFWLEKARGVYGLIVQHLVWLDYFTVEH